MKVYVIIEENSPRLAIECGGYDIISAYENFEEAYNAALEQAELHCVMGYEIVDRYDGQCGTKAGFTLYYNGDEDSELWFNIVVEPVEINISKEEQK